MERSPLADRDIIPTPELIEKYLQAAYPVYETFSQYLSQASNGLNPIWMYYNDVKYWLCKVQHKKKTVFWLTIWEGYFKLTLYFTEKYSPAIAGLEIDPALKEQHQANRLSGKLRPLTLDISRSEQLQDAYRLIEYKIQSTLPSRGATTR